MFAKLFRYAFLSATQIRPKGRNSIDCTNAFVRASAPANAISLRCNHSTRHLKYEPRRREAMKFAPAKKIRDLWCPNPSPTSIFSKISSFRNFGVMHHLAWDGVTFSFRNGWPSYFQKMKFNNIEAECFQNFSEIHSFQLRKSGPKTENLCIVQAHPCEQLPLQM